jgi:ArsR family transcriptional regulator
MGISTGKLAIPLRLLRLLLDGPGTKVYMYISAWDRGRFSRAWPRLANQGAARAQVRSMDEMVRMLKALADPTRIRIAQLLSTRDELCVCELVDALGVAQYSISRHLGVLKAAGLVDDWRQGKWMHYALGRDLSSDDRAVITAVCARTRADARTRQDLRRLEQHLRPRVDGEVVTCRP